MDNRRKIKEETIEYFEEIDDEGERRIRVVTETKVFSQTILILDTTQQDRQQLNIYDYETCGLQGGDTVRTGTSL